MTKTHNFEVQSFHDDEWKIVTVHQEREAAIQAAEELLAGSYHHSVRVFEEVYDDASGESQSRTIFRKAKGEAAADRHPPAPGEHAAPVVGHPHPAAREKVKVPSKEIGKTYEESYRKFVRYLVLLVLSMGGIALAALGAMYFYLDLLGR